MEDLKILIELVKEEGLSKDRLEQYHTEITYLDSILRLELAPIEKEEALFFDLSKHKEGANLPEFHTATRYEISKEIPDIKIKRMWKATEKGQRQIELSHMLKITPKLLGSLKTRLYGIAY